jgi:glycosyltransferase involved in cell wall biosynthesis
MDISIVIPLLNEEGNIKLLSDRLIEVLNSITDVYEIIFVDDGSSDQSLEIIKKLSKENNHIKGITFSRNFGHQIALMAGLEHTQGDIVITMDADLQHPPEVIFNLIQKYNEGYDIVNTLRRDSKHTGYLKKSSSKGFYKIINLLSEVNIEPASADFRLMKRKTVNEFLKLPEKDRFTRGLISWMGFKQTTIEYDTPIRHSGETKYSWRKMIGLATDGITSFSSKPLRISFYIGLFVSLIGLFYAIYAVVQYIQGDTQPGWTSILVSILIIGGIQLLSIGIIGEYLARIFKESKNRPLYIVKEYINEKSNS